MAVALRLPTIANHPAYIAEEGIVMAWIRWRGHTAQLMATIGDHGKQRQQYLGSLGAEYTVPEPVKARITARFPTLTIDWDAVNRTVAAGPPGTPPPSPAAWDWARVEWLLEDWSQTGPSAYPYESQALHHAALILRQWRARTEQAAKEGNSSNRVTE